jgi:hypothetical protein
MQEVKIWRFDENEKPKLETQKSFVMNDRRSIERMTIPSLCIARI